MASSRFIRYWLPIVCWAALIFALSSIPSLSSGLGFWDLILRKLAHTTEYAVLAILFQRALERPSLAFACTVAYAATDELHQHFVRGRVGSPIDVGIDSVGALVGLLVYLHWRRMVVARHSAP
jgi:VanZ family protein